MTKLSELFTDESKWVKKMFAGYRAAPKAPPVPPSDREKPANCFCLSEGLRVVLPDDNIGYDSLLEPRRALRRKVIAAIHKLFPIRIPKPGGIITFNDHPETTFADVQAVIREVESAQ